MTGPAIVSLDLFFFATPADYTGVVKYGD